MRKSRSMRRHVELQSEFAKVRKAYKGGLPKLFDLVPKELKETLRMARGKGASYDTLSRIMCDDGYLVRRDCIRDWFLRGAK